MNIDADDRVRNKKTRHPTKKNDDRLQGPLPARRHHRGRDQDPASRDGGGGLFGGVGAALAGSASLGSVLSAPRRAEGSVAATATPALGGGGGGGEEGPAELAAAAAEEEGEEA